MPRNVGVVVVAAGRGERLGGKVPKQYREIAGVPMLLRALRPFTAHPDVAQVVIALPAEDVANPPGWLAALTGGSLVLVPGGAERSASVASGLKALSPACEIVLVHDAARPFVGRELIDAVIQAARTGAGAVPALALRDTVKETKGPSSITVERTVPRERLWRAQTPQGFPREVLMRAHAMPSGEGASDDAALVERLGHEVRLVPGSERNLKVTTAEDLRLAELIAKME
ncbi:MAG TPA: 2-C-methyl-D-erythritol 4-phosphate cytidylyltransferase [Gemmatimonadales bacterium]|nr:2-C-methyl-D-erythritol 4-phosphate cytidylyltransferase [Gemmatimonadales bacterium]